jgi:hypothetical protein
MAGVTGGPQPTGLAVDPSSGDVVVAGDFAGTANFGGGFVGDGDAGAGYGFVARYDGIGTLRWVQPYYGDDDPYGVVPADALQ